MKRRRLLKQFALFNVFVALPLTVLFIWVLLPRLLDSDLPKSSRLPEAAICWVATAISGWRWLSRLQAREM